MTYLVGTSIFHNRNTKTRFCKVIRRINIYFEHIFDGVNSFITKDPNMKNNEGNVYTLQMSNQAFSE